jgi:hypothetical protein
MFHILPFDKSFLKRLKCLMFLQLSVVNKGTFREQRAKAQKVWNFHFKAKENGADFFYPGTRH